MLRLAERHKVPRKSFLDAYVDHEMEEGWLTRVGKLERVLGPFTQDAALRLDLAPALRIMPMRGLG